MYKPRPTHGAALCVAVALVAACTKRNELFCCVTAADCERLKLPPGDIRPCDDGLVCVQNYCVPASCEQSACEAAAPVCDRATDECVGCTDAADCGLFPDRPVCNPTSGSCVECTTSVSCTATQPVCDGNACRACKLDVECASGACAGDGTCVPEANAIYLSPQGNDVLPCSRQAPCQGLSFALLQATSARSHIVLAAGTHVVPSALFVDLNVQELTIHGGGSTMQGGTSDGLLTFYIPATLRDVALVNPTVGDGSALGVSARVVLENVTLRANTAVFAGAPLTMKSVTIEAAGRGIRNNGGSLIIDRATIRGGTVGIESIGGSVDITNLLVHDTSGIGIDLSNTIGTMQFSTIVQTGIVTLRSSIVWTPIVQPRVAVQGCNLGASMIVGPMAASGAANVDPQFVDPLGDYHLTGGSPARDMVESGPALDFEGDPRPHGARYDIGADEGR